MKKIFKKIVVLTLLIATTFQTLAPSIVMAVTYEDGNEITLTGSPTLNGTSLDYEHGGVQITKKHEGNTTNVTTTTFSVELGDEIVIKLFADENYTGKLVKGIDEEITLIEGEYKFTIGQEKDETLTFTPSFVEEEEAPVVKYNFRLNGVDFTNVGNGDTLSVPSDFNFDEVEELYFTKIDVNDGEQVYNYEANEYSYNLLDTQERHILEVNATKTSDNLIKLRIQAHANDIQEEDYGYMKGPDDYYEFYIPELMLVKDEFKGVEITTNIMPDSYDFTTWNGVDLATTTESEPGIVTVYYGEDTINFSSAVTSNIQSIELMENSGIPEDAISIDNTTFEVTILSNYYNEIPLKITLEDDTTGYVIVNRIGIFIGTVNQGSEVFYHGASADVGNNLNVDTDKDRIVAVFYHEDTKPYLDYKLIVNITYEDGTTETSIAKGVGDVANSNGNIVGSDYILWEGNSNMPVKVSVTAIDAEALTDEDVFGGATFGSGEGVIWERD